MDRQQDFGAIAKAIIDSNLYMTLGTADEDGCPRVSPVYYAPEGYAEFYWVSSPEATHSRNITVRPEVAIVVFDSRAPIRLRAGGVRVGRRGGAHERRPRQGHRHLLPQVSSARGKRVDSR
jgi:hypothetical protein